MATQPETGLATQQQRPTSIATGNQGLQLRSMDDMWRFANAVVKARLAPKGMESPEAVLIALQLGAEVGLTPMASVQNIAVVNNRPSIWGDAMLALCQASPSFDRTRFKEWIEGEGDKMVAHCQSARVGAPEDHTTFSVADAKAAGLWNKAGPWSQYPKRMLAMRARGFSLRNSCADLLKGIISREEAGDIVETVQPVEAHNVDGAERLLNRISPPEQPVPPQAPVASEPEAPAQPVHDPRLPELRAAISARAATLGTHSDVVAEAMVGLGIGYLTELDTVMNVEAMEDVLKWLDEKIAEQQVNSGSLIPNNDPLPQVEPSQVRPGVTRRKS